ncbi:MAG TPA: hypothetical protein P5307_28325, partial [Pirellulaceae bacterium]|nr:hypothetical protein [Pirellulaceae bacterium]
SIANALPARPAIDLNADGIDDLLIGARAVPDNAEDQDTLLGRTYVVYGSNILVTLPTAAIRSLENFSVPGSGSFVKNRGTGRPEIFRDGGEPFALSGANTEQWFRFSTLGDGSVGDSIQLIPESPLHAFNGDVLTMAIFDSMGRRLPQESQAFDLRDLEAGDYLLRVSGQPSVPYHFKMNAPTAGHTHETSTLPDRDVVDGGEGRDTLYGNDDLDRIYGRSGGDTLVGESIELRDLGPNDRIANVAPGELSGNVNLPEGDPVVTIVDVGLWTAIAAELNIPITTGVYNFQTVPFLASEIRESQLATITVLDASDAIVAGLADLTKLPHLRSLDLSNGLSTFTNITPLASLSELRHLSLQNTEAPRGPAPFDWTQLLQLETLIPNARYLNNIPDNFVIDEGDAIEFRTALSGTYRIRDAAGVSHFIQ